MKLEDEGGGYLLASAAKNEDLIHFGELLSSHFLSPEEKKLRTYAPLPYDMFEYEHNEEIKQEDSLNNDSVLSDQSDEEDKEEELEFFSPQEHYVQTIQSLSDVEVMLLHGTDRNKEEGLRILNETSYVPRNKEKLIVVMCLASFIDELPDRAPDFWSWVKNHILIVPSLGLIPHVLNRYKQIADQLRPGSPLNTTLKTINEEFVLLQNKFTAIKPILSMNPKFSKIIHLLNRFPDAANKTSEKIQFLLDLLKPLNKITDENFNSEEGRITIDRIIKKGLKSLSNISEPFNSAMNIIKSLTPILQALSKSTNNSGEQTNFIESIQNLYQDFSHQKLNLVMSSVEIGSVSSSKTLISRSLNDLSRNNWDWNSLAHRLSLDVVLVSKLIGAANVKVREESISTKGTGSHYAFVNAIKVLGEDNLRIFLTWQANTVHMELGPPFRPIFDGLYLHTVYTIKLVQKMVEILRKHNAIMDIDDHLLKTATQMQNLGSVFLIEYAANFLASQSNIPPRERHPYFDYTARAYPRRENVFDQFISTKELLDFERNLFNVTHTEIGKNVAQKLEWQESDPIAWIMEYHHHPAFCILAKNETETISTSSPIDILDKKRIPVALSTLYLIITANQIFEYYATFKELRRTAEELKEYQNGLSSNKGIDKQFLRSTQSIRTILSRQTIMEEMIVYLKELISNYRSILPNAKQNFTNVIFDQELI
jgi:hypothetical protein